MKKTIVLLTFAPLYLFLANCSSPVKKTFVDLVNDINSMHKVNAKPVYIMPSVEMLCKIDPQRMAESKKNPHNRKVINVYINHEGLSEMTAKDPVFPEGTVVIKEKFLPVKSNRSKPGKIELYTIMVKRSKGFNPACGDWEFAAVSGDLKTVKSGKLESCMSCHKNYASTDFITREGYLP